MNILSLAYLGNVQWFAKVLFSDYVIDTGEHYVRQSYRNRCEIATAGGCTALTVNVVKMPNFAKLPMRDIRIDYSKRWQHQHLQSLVSAYRSAPYFDHYWPELEPFFARRHEFLADLNAGLAQRLMQLLGSAATLNVSEKYIEPDTPDITDLRDAISPKPRLARPDPLFAPQPYWQVFSAVRPFEPNLSVIDLLMCEGPHAAGIIRQSVL
ncbi:WbqC family protein [Alistipes sp. OttesenSCG-928-B03]|nr:WbqC family protein [Alistipes sp. OttesenSCG-928-B03]